MKNKTLLIVFLVLLSIYGLNRLFSGKRDGNFSSALIKLDTAAITAITINLLDPDPQELTLKREEEGWIVSNGQLNTKALPEAVSALLKSLALVQTQFIVTDKPDKWSNYEVNEGQGVSVQVYKGSKKIEDFIVGGLNYNAETQTALGYIRLSGQKEVYAVDGMQAVNFIQQFEAYRMRELVKMKRAMIVNEFSCQFADTTLAFQKKNGQWLLNQNLALDSMTVENYLNVLRNVTMETFADDFDETQAKRLHYATLSLKGDNITAPFVIDCYKDTTRQRPYILHSNYNPETWFDSDSAGVFNQLFIDVRKLGRPAPSRKG